MDADRYTICGKATDRGEGHEPGKVVVQTVGQNVKDPRDLVQPFLSNIRYLRRPRLLPKLSVEGSIRFACSNKIKQLANG